MPKTNRQSGRMYAGESAEERLARQRATFLAAGLQLFGTIGYRATTVRALCQEAGLTDRYFYKTFGSMEDLLIAVYTESVDEMERQIGRALIEAPPADIDQAIEDGLTAFFTAFEDARVARVCWLEVLGVSPRVDATYTERVVRFAHIVEAQGRAWGDPGEVPDGEVHLMAVGMVGAVIQSATQWLLSDYEASRETLVSANARLFKATVRAFGG